MVEGELVTFLHGAEFGRERFRDDGAVLASEVVFAAARFRVSVTRATGAVRVEPHGAEPIERTLAAGEFALENGSWQAFALLAEALPDAPARVEQAFTALIPAQGARVPGCSVTAHPRAADGSRTLEVRIGRAAVTVQVSAAGAVLRGEVPAQGLEVLPAGERPASAAASVAAVPEGVVEEPFEVVGVGGVTLRGTLARPAQLAPAPPVALFIAGSGPTDRDCNSPAMGLRTDAFRLLAHGLAARGVASARYDKRGVGASDRGPPESELVLAHFVGDAAAVAAHLRRDGRFGALTAVGHSEGGLIALELAQLAQLDAVVLLAAAGRPLAVILREQLARTLPADALAEAERIIGCLARGADPEPVPRALDPLFRASVRPFLASVLTRDPAEVIAGVGARITIVQGETDAQVAVEDARRLATARPDARLVVLPRTNHVLKVEDSPALPQASYHDPARPLAPGLLDAVLAGVAR